MRKQIDEKSFDIEDSIETRVYEEHLRTAIKKQSFTENMKKYCELKTCDSKFDFVTGLLVSKRPSIKIYYEELGAERIRALGYKESALKNEIKNQNEKNRLASEFKKLF